MIQTTAEATGDLIGNKIDYEIKGVSKTSPQNNSETNEEKILSERYISPKKCPPFTNCISEINNTQVDDAQDIDIVMLIYNLIIYSEIHSKTSGLYRNTIGMNQL